MSRIRLGNWINFAGNCLLEQNIEYEGEYRFRLDFRAPSDELTKLDAIIIIMKEMSIFAKSAFDDDDRSYIRYSQFSSINCRELLIEFWPIQNSRFTARGLKNKA